MSLTTETILPKPPEWMRPDRPEAICDLAHGQTVILDVGIKFVSLVGSQNEARNLTTGIVTLEPLANLAYHLHPFAESVTVLRGEVLAEVQGRRYTLHEFDNLVVPRQAAHRVTNTCPTQPAVLHVAMGATSLNRAPVDESFDVEKIPDDFSDYRGPERVTRLKFARYYELGVNTAFVDYFNINLLPDIEMSGGYGRFQPGSRLPAHVHDFDESICIIEGTATCVVEGKRYYLSDCSTALQPRGRVHFFANETDTPMAMIWVYAGPRPTRLIVDERCATMPGWAW